MQDTEAVRITHPQVLGWGCAVLHKGMNFWLDLTNCFLQIMEAAATSALSKVMSVQLQQGILNAGKA